MIIDSVVWIAYKNKKDKWHEKAVSILSKIMEKRKFVYISEYIIAETVNFLLRKTTFDTALETLNMFITSKKIEILINDEISIRNTKEIFEKYKGLSFTDANIIVLMLENNIKEICSFDRGFDSVKEITRISTI